MSFKVHYNFRLIFRHFGSISNAVETLLSVENRPKNQGSSHRGEIVAPFHYLACRHIFRISIVLVKVVLLIKRKESPIGRQIWHERSLVVGKLGTNEGCLSANWARTKSVGKLGLCTAPTFFCSFVPAKSSLEFFPRRLNPLLTQGKVFSTFL